jgi:putative NADH-flavin reductase
MKNTIKIAVVGSTGKSGKFLVKQLLEEGHPFKALIRNPENFKIENPLAEVVHGDICDIDNVRSLLLDCQAVISTLGMGVPYDNPTVCGMGTTNILKVMREVGINRYIVVTGLNVDTPFDVKSPKTKFATDWMYQNYPITTADRQKEYELLSESNVDWTLVRSPLILQTDERKVSGTSLQDCTGDTISASDLAHFLLKQLEEKAFLKKAPFIFNI